MQNYIYNDAIKITMNYVKMRVNDMLKDKLNGSEVFSTGINKHIEIQTYTLEVCRCVCMRNIS